MIPAEVLAALGDTPPHMCRQTHIHWENSLIAQQKWWLMVVLYTVCWLHTWVSSSCLANNVCRNFSGQTDDHDWKRRVPIVCSTGRRLYAIVHLGLMFLTEWAEPKHLYLYSTTTKKFKIYLQFISFNKPETSTKWKSYTEHSGHFVALLKKHNTKLNVCLRVRLFALEGGED